MFDWDGVDDDDGDDDNDDSDGFVVVVGAKIMFIPVALSVFKPIV